MGTTVIIVLAACTLFFVAGAPLSHLALLLGAGGAIAYFVITHQDYQLDRLVSFTARTPIRRASASRSCSS